MSLVIDKRISSVMLRMACLPMLAMVLILAPGVAPLFAQSASASVVAPSIFIDTPAQGAAVSGTVTVAGWAIDNTSAAGTAIGSVKVLVDGTAVGTPTYGVSRPDVCAAYPGRPGCPNVGYTYSLNTATLTAGAHSITVQATDSDSTPDTGSASVTVIVSGAAVTPSVFIDSPASGATVSGTVTVSGWAIDNTSTIGTAIGSVQVLVDGTAAGTATYGVNRSDVCAAYPGRPGCPNVGYSYALNTTTLTAGSHTITLKATDAGSVPTTNSASVAVIVAGPAVTPSVFIDTPASGATVSGTVNVSGWAIDNTSVVGTAIGSVQVLVDGTAVGAATYGVNRPDVCAAYPGRPGCPNVGYTYSLNTATLTGGSHTITLKATDAGSVPTTNSTSVTVIVAGAAVTPSVFIDSPASGATVSGTVNVSGWAIDNTSTIGTAIGSVQVLVDGTAVGAATYGVSRPDVCAAYPGRLGCPSVGYTYSLNTATLAAGSHTITVTAADAGGTPDTASATVSVQTGPPACILSSYVIPAGPTYSTQSGSHTLSRITTWAPGISGGVPQRTSVCTTLSPLGSGGDDGGAISNAIASCPDNEVVMLNPGTYSVQTAIVWSKNNVAVRGSGGPGVAPSKQTRLIADPSLYGPVVNIGLNLFPHPQTTSASLTADALQGASSATVSSTAGLNVGDLVLIDMLIDPADDMGSWIVTAPAGTTGLVFPYAEYNPDRSPQGDASRGWFNRTNRPVAQIMEIQSIAGNTVAFSAPFHITFDVAHSAQLTAFDVEPLTNSGLENVYVSGVPAPGGQVQYNNIVLNLAKYSWVKNVESDNSNGDSVGIDQSFRCIVRDSYIHSTINPTPGGAGYGLEFSFGSADNLAENNISWNFNKVDVMRATGGGNVLAYNYMDDGWIAYQPDWVESGINAAHMTTPHFELFEGNLSFALGTDDTWGDSIFITWLRNVATSHRSAWPPLNTYTFNGNTQTTGCTSGGPGDYTCIAYTDVGNRQAAALTYGDVFFNEIGNVLGSSGMPVAPQTQGFTYATSAPDWPGDPVPMWLVGFGDWNGNSAVDQGVVNTILRDGNYDYATNSVHWNGSAQTLPNSLYACSKPAFFGSYNWPWADGSNASSPYYTHSFQYYPLSLTLGTFGTTGTLVTYPGYQLPAYVRFLQLHGIETLPATCSSATLSNMPAACSLLFTGVAQ